MTRKKFSLIRYLNESVQSDLLYNEIMHNKSGIFKVFAMRRNYSDSAVPKHFFKTSSNLTEYLKYVKSLLEKIDLYNEQYQLYTKKGQQIPGSLKEISKDKLIAHISKINQYTKQVERNIKAAINKDDTSLLRAYIGKDLANFTDHNFKKFTVAELKKMKNLPTAMKNNNVCFWFNGEDIVDSNNLPLSAGSLLAVSKNDRIMLSVVDNYNYKYFLERHAALNKYGITEKILKPLGDDNVEINIVTGAMNAIKADPKMRTLFDTSKNDSLDYGYRSTMSTVDIGYLSINDLRIERSSDSCDKLGNIWNSKAYLGANFHWGASPKDYVITLQLTPDVYPRTYVDDDTGEVNKVLNNEKELESFDSDALQTGTSFCGISAEEYSFDRKHSAREWKTKLDDNSHHKYTYDRPHEKMKALGIIHERMPWDIDRDGNVIPYSIEKDYLTCEFKGLNANRYREQKSTIAAVKFAKGARKGIDIVRQKLDSANKDFNDLCVYAGSNFIKYAKVYSAIVRSINTAKTFLAALGKTYKEIIELYNRAVYAINTDGRDVISSYGRSNPRYADINSITRSIISGMSKCMNAIESDIKEFNRQVIYARKTMLVDENYNDVDESYYTDAGDKEADTQQQ